MTVGRAPPPAVTGAVQMLISVPSEAWKPRSFTYVFPAESVTLAAVAPAPLHIPVTTTSRLPAVIADVGVTERPDAGTCRPAASTFWTNAGAGVAPGVTPLDGVDSGPSPIALRARTRNV